MLNIQNLDNHLNTKSTTIPATTPFENFSFPTPFITFEYSETVTPGSFPVDLVRILKILAVEVRAYSHLVQSKHFYIPIFP